MPIEKADLDDGFARISRTLLFVWSCMGLSPTELEILVHMSAYAWARFTKEPGYQTGLWPAKIVEIFSGVIGRTQIYAALAKLEAKHAIIGTSDGFEINPRVGEHLKPELRLIAERMKQTHDRFLATPIERKSGKPDEKSGKPDEKSGKPDRQKRRSANEEPVGTEDAVIERLDINSSSSYVVTPQAIAHKADDDERKNGETNPKQLEIDLKTQSKLIFSLAQRVSKFSGQKPRDVLIKDLSAIYGFEKPRINAGLACVLMAVKNGVIRRVNELRALVVHAIENPGLYPAASAEDALREDPKPTGPGEQELEALVNEAHNARIGKLSVSQNNSANNG